MSLNSKIQEAYAIKSGMEEIDKDMEKLKNNKAELQKRLDNLNAEILAEMIKNGNKEVETEDHIFANHYSRTEFTYGDEKALLKYLQEYGLDEYINCKTTTTISINKNALKKDLKIKQDLKESLKDFVGDKTTDYVVVANAETHQKMLEHIND